MMMMERGLFIIHQPPSRQAVRPRRESGCSVITLLYLYCYFVTDYMHTRLKLTLSEIRLDIVISNREM